MQSGEFGRIEEATRPFEIERRKIACPFVSESEGGLLLRRTERAIHRGKTPERFCRAKPRFGDGVDHETGLVTVFRGRSPGNHFERLNGVDGKLSREGFALLIADRLIVQRYRRLRVIAKRVKEPVRISYCVGRGLGDTVAQSAARCSENHFAS